MNGLMDNRINEGFPFIQPSANPFILVQSPDVDCYLGICICQNGSILHNQFRFV